MYWVKGFAQHEGAHFNIIGFKNIKDIKDGDKIVFEYGKSNRYVVMDADCIDGRKVFGTIITSDTKFATPNKICCFKFLPWEKIGILEA